MKQAVDSESKSGISPTTSSPIVFNPPLAIMELEGFPLRLDLTFS
jgi:hypothetical protein